MRLSILIFTAVALNLCGASYEGSNQDCASPEGGTCNSNAAEDGVGLLQARIREHNFSRTSVPQACQVGDQVSCPGSTDVACAGKQCCPGVGGGPTFPCPSAPESWGAGFCSSPVKVEDCLQGPTPTSAPAPPTSAPAPPTFAPAPPTSAPAPPTSAPTTPGPTPSSGTTVLIITNNEFEDGVAFCRGPVGLKNVFLDSGLTEPAANSSLDCSSASSASAKEWGQGVPEGTTLALGLKRKESTNLYIAADGTWYSGTCWFQDVTSNKKQSLAKGPSYQSQFEFTISETGEGSGVVSFDVTSVEGVSGGLKMTYADDRGNSVEDVAVPGKFEGTSLKIVEAPGYGFPTVLSNKWAEGDCTCTQWSPDSAECNTDACLAGCPSPLADNAYGQHACRQYYAKEYTVDTSYCGWLYKEKSETYCWAMDEWLCLDTSCGYGGVDQPAADYTSSLPEDAAANTYSCGHGKNLPSATPGVNWWTNGPGCKDKVIDGVPTNPIVPRSGGTVNMIFEDLPWLHGK